MAGSWWYLAGTACLFLAMAVTSLHILLNIRDESERAMMWLLLVFALPVFGILLYLFCGLSRRDTFGNRVIRSLERISRTEAQPVLDLFAARNAGLMPFQALTADAAAARRSFDFRNMLDRQFPDCSPLTGNEMELLCDGEEAYPRMVEAIRSAKSSIHMQSFIIANDRVGTAIFNALSDKAAEGIPVKVLYDSFGSFGAMRSTFFRKYADRSVNLSIRAFSHATLVFPWRNQLRNHRKLLVVDGVTAFLGGLNISSDNFSFSLKNSPAIHDLHCQIRGPAVSDLQMTFLEDWCIAAKVPPEKVFRPGFFPPPVRRGDNSVRVIPSGHGYCFQGSEQCFFTAAATAGKYIWLNTPYFVPDKPFIKALRTAARRGVDVRILMPANNNHRFMKLASKNLYASLQNDGVRIFERRGVFTHAKAMLVDGEWALFGSSNCDIRSFRLNYELDLVVEGSFLSQLHAQLRHEFDNADEIFLEDSLRTSFPAKLAQSFCALFTPIL